jgi:hypothetical protein
LGSWLREAADDALIRTSFHVLDLRRQLSTSWQIVSKIGMGFLAIGLRETEGRTGPASV